jgi:hypothetical protein
MANQTRALWEIAADVRAHWAKVNYAAEPYLAAMDELTLITDNYYADDADSMVRYFLSNATTWRGPDARRIKKELNGMLLWASMKCSSHSQMVKTQ